MYTNVKSVRVRKYPLETKTMGLSCRTVGGSPRILAPTHGAAKLKSRTKVQQSFIVVIYLFHRVCKSRQLLQIRRPLPQRDLLLWCDDIVSSILSLPEKTRNVHIESFCEPATRLTDLVIHFHRLKDAGSVKTTMTEKQAIDENDLRFLIWKFWKF